MRLRLRLHHRNISIVSIRVGNYISSALPLSNILYIHGHRCWSRWYSLLVTRIHLFVECVRRMRAYTNAHSTHCLSRSAVLRVRVRVRQHQHDREQALKQ